MRYSTKEEIARRAAAAKLYKPKQIEQQIRSQKAMGLPKDPRGDLVAAAVKGSASAKFNLIALFGTAQAAHLIKNYKGDTKHVFKKELCDGERDQEQDLEFEEEY